MKGFLCLFEVKMANTWIYLIKDNHTGFYKIGKSHNPYKRLKELMRQPTILPIPYEFKLVEAWNGEGIYETDLHKMFSAERQRGEWFSLVEMDIEYLYDKLSDLIKLSDGVSDNTKRTQEKWEKLRELSEPSDWLDCVVEGWGIEV